MYLNIPPFMTDVDPRLTALKTWLACLDSRQGQPTLGLDATTLAPASSDASFRRYFRLQGAVGTLIVMDAPPAQEDCRPFVDVATRLRDGGLNVPHILARDAAQGFMLLTDLGEKTYYQRIQEGLSDTELQSIYRDALKALVQMQQVSCSGLPPYDRAKLAEELQVFEQWYVQVHHGVTLDDTTRSRLTSILDQLARAAATDRPVLVHRDFHSPNLMSSQKAADGPNPGIIDFQDALGGSIAYDIASLVMDARTTWDEAQQLDWAIRYWEMARAAGLPVDPEFAEFHQRYEWTALQRNLRILGVFARLHHRDGKANYLAHIPRVTGYVRQVAARYGVFGPLRKLIDTLEERAAAQGKPI